MNIIKPLRADLVYVGQLVVTDLSDNTQVFTVAGFMDDMAILQCFKGKSFESKGYPKHKLYEPTVRQIESSITNNGPLVNVSDICAWA